MTGRSLTPQTMDQLLAAHASSLHTLDISTITVSPLFEFFASLSPDMRAQWSTETHCAPGEIIFDEGEEGDFMALIWSGQIAIIKGQSEALTVLGYRGSGEVIGEMAVIEKRSRSATAVALEPSSLLIINRTSFEHLLVSNAALALSMMATLSARLRSSDQARSMQTQAEQKMKHDLATAGEVQHRFLPEVVPQVPGWDMAAHLIPLWQTTGDYYDFIELGEQKLGILIADVTDKGTGAALFMALSRTLIRTFAVQYPDAPAQALRSANDRILADTRSDQFVTVFYGVLDLAAGTLVYTNAGHNPPILLHGDLTASILDRTGIPLGMFQDMIWQERTVSFALGDTLILYTDGISEAQNVSGDQIGARRLLEVGQTTMNGTAQTILDALLADVQTFMGPAPQLDDMTLFVIQRRGAA